MPEKFDVRYSVIFCKKHKQIYEAKVKVHLTSRDCINVDELIKLVHDAEKCTQCRWSTEFDGKSEE